MGRQPALHHAPIHGGPSTCADHHDDGCPDDNNGCSDDNHGRSDDYCCPFYDCCATSDLTKFGFTDHRLPNPTDWCTGCTSSFDIAVGSTTSADLTSNNTTSRPRCRRPRFDRRR